jgi:hypothetical protein
MTMSGVGDNIQLQILLADVLVGAGRVPGEAPDPDWVAAARDGLMVPPGGVHLQFELADADGGQIWGEGRPADIPLVEGRRVIVVRPPSYARGSNIGRQYPLMVPQLTVDRELPADDAKAWTARLS